MHDICRRDALASPLLQGNDHVVYNGSFFYYNHGEIPRIIRYQLSTKTIGDPLEIRPNGVVRNGGGPLLTQLYKPQQPGSYLDFSTDENGLWGVFGLALDNNTVVMKFDSESLQIQGNQVFIAVVNYGHFHSTIRVAYLDSNGNLYFSILIVRSSMPWRNSRQD